MPDQKEDARSGWRSRRNDAQGRKSRVSDEDKRLGNIARGKLLTELRDARDFSPAVAGPAPEGEDYIAAMSDEDLVALYKQLHNGRAPAPKAKRPTIEKSVRVKQAETVAPVGEGNTEMGADELALDEADMIQGDDV